MVCCVISSSRMVYLTVVNSPVVANSTLNWTMWENLKHFKKVKGTLQRENKANEPSGIQKHLAFARSLIDSGQGDLLILTIYNVTSSRLVMEKMCRFTPRLHCPCCFTGQQLQGYCCGWISYPCSCQALSAITLVSNATVTIHPIARSRLVL